MDRPSDRVANRLLAVNGIRNLERVVAQIVP